MMENNPSFVCQKMDISSKDNIKVERNGSPTYKKDHTTNSSTSAFSTTVPSMLKCVANSKSPNLQVPASASNGESLPNNSNNSSPKMGSRRIFTPQFKLQVLESYRNDNDCKGNQRATARKYNIHRRQIQKWLQCESTLRSSVANINQNNVKHQFHNISHPHSHPHMQLPITSSAVNSSHYVSHNHSHHQHPHQATHHSHQHPLSLETARHSVSLSSLPASSLPAGVASPCGATQGVLAAANLAAVVAAAAAAGAAGAMVIASTSVTDTSTTATPLRPKAISGTTSTLSPSILYPHHHHHYPLAHTLTPVGSVPVSVPILTHHLPPQHFHHHYQYHNLSSLPQIQSAPPTPTHTTCQSSTSIHSQAYKNTQSLQSSAFMPSACLPVAVLSTATSAAVDTTAVNAPALIESIEKHRERHEEQNRINSDESLEYETTKPFTTSTAEIEDSTGNSYVHNENTYASYRHSENGSENSHEAKYKGLEQYVPYAYDSLHSNSSAMTPIDLSVGSRRENRWEEETNFKIFLKVNEDTTEERGCDECSQNGAINDSSVVDLTFRKRKVISSNKLTHDHPEKFPKFSDGNHSISNNIQTSTIKSESLESKENGNDDVDIEVELEEKSAPMKPVKLFKPYLLDEEDNENKSTKSKSSEAKLSEQREPIIWSHHPECLSPHSYDSRQDSSRGSNFQSPSIEKFTFPVGSPCLSENTTVAHIAKSGCIDSALSPTSAAEFSTSFRCSKGSPVSGYESSSSTYSESSYRGESFGLFQNGTCCLDLHMHAVHNNYSVIPKQTHVQRWLDQDTNHDPPTTNSSIALYA